VARWREKERERETDRQRLDSVMLFWENDLLGGFQCWLMWVTEHSTSRVHNRDVSPNEIPEEIPDEIPNEIPEDTSLSSINLNQVIADLLWY
jgi:hypothetical protein